MSKALPFTKKDTVYSFSLKKEINALRDDFSTYNSAENALTTRRRDIAPAFMKLYARFRKETGKTFVAFVHEFDPKMPVDRKHYPNHPTYRNALYLRRLVEAPHTTVQHRRTMSPFRVLAYTMNSLMFYVKKQKADPVEIMLSLKRISRWDDRQVQKLQQVMRRASALAIPGAPRLVKREVRAVNEQLRLVNG